MIDAENESKRGITLKFSEKGTSMMEILITVAILAVLASLGFTSYKELKARYDLYSTASRIYGDMEWCRQKSMGSPHGYGLYFTSKSYKVFKDMNDNGSFDSGIDTEFKDTSFNHITLSGYPAGGYVYSRRGGPNSSFTLTLRDHYGHTKQIVVSLFKTRMK